MLKLTSDLIKQEVGAIIDVIRTLYSDL